MRYRMLAVVALLVASPALAELPGDLDPTFNGGQPVLLDLARTVPISTFLDAATFDDQGRVVVTGNTSDENGRTALCIARVGADGTPDASFGTNGSTVVQVGLGSGMLAPRSSGRGIGPRPNGAGWLIGGTATGSDERGAVLAAAFDSNGMLDPGYGNGGSVRPQPADATRSTIADYADVGPDGAVYVAGTLDPLTTGNRQLDATKITAAGQPDGTFGNVPAQGSFVSTFSQSANPGTQASGVLLTDAGLLVIGQTNDASNRQQILAVRLTASGGLDSDFGGGTGFFRAQVADPLASTRDSQARTAAVAPNGAIYVGGGASDGDGNFAMSVTRLTPGGMLDGTFAGGGTRRLQTSTATSRFCAVTELVVQSDGKIIVVGFSRLSGSDFEGVVARLDTTGDLDSSFGTNGLVRLNFGDDTVPGRATISPDGRSVVVLGAVTMDGVSRGMIARVLLEPYTPPSTTTTTLPDAGCAAAPSLDGVQCRLDALAATLGNAAPSGKLAARLGRTLSRADDRVTAGAGATGKAQRRKLKKGAALLKKLGKQLASKPAVSGIAADARAALIAQVTAVADELRSLAAAA